LENVVASSPAEPTTSAVRRPPQRRPALVAAAVFVLVFVVALGSNRSLARVGGPGHVLAARTIAGDLGVVLLVLVLAVAAVIASALWGGGLLRRRRGDDEPEWAVEETPMWWEKPLLLAMAFLPAAGLVAAIVFLVRLWGGATRPARTVVPPSASIAPSGHASPGAVPSQHAAAPVVHWWIFAAAALVLLAAAALAVVWRRLHPVESRLGRAVEARELQAVIEESLEELEREPDPRRAVIRAYTGMERTLARRGLGRRPFEAPLEYLARTLVALRVSRPAGERLTALFQRARFSEHTIDPGMKQEAIGALVRVRDELAEQGR
jgi:hypothetical protein